MDLGESLVQDFQKFVSTKCSKKKKKDETRGKL